MSKIKTKLKTILVIGTGGTIAGVGDVGKSTSYTSAQIEIDTLLSDVPCLEEVAETKSIDLFSVDSQNITPNHWLKLASYINSQAKKEDVQGFVITHGTDSMEETAYFLNLTVKTNKPIVLTGAIRPSTAISADGPFNLFQAVALARNKRALDKGVMVVFSDGIYGARDVRKENTFKPNAFGSGDLGCIGYMWEDEVHLYNTSLKKHTTNSEFDVSKTKKLPKIEILLAYSGADVNLIDHFAENSDGLVIAGVGNGGCNDEWDEKIENLLSKGYPVVRASRTLGGRVAHTDQVETQGIYSDTLTPQKARILLMLALTKTNDIREIQRMFLEY